jgi:flagellar motor switch protein FliM
VIEAVLNQFDTEIRALTNGIGLNQFHIGRIEHTPQGLRHTLADQQYLIFRVNLDIGEDGRSGSFHYALPLSIIEPIENALRGSGATRVQGESESWSRQMRAAVNQARIRLTAVIDRCQMPVAEISRLDVGSVFPLSDVTLDDVMLELKTASETRVIGRGRLGVFKRNKAVRLIEPLDRTFFDPLINVLGVISGASADHGGADGVAVDHAKDLHKAHGGNDSPVTAAKARNK